ncbi:MAG: lamin tail domain-containing protein [Candidatus Pacebacteria bacterium]|nr:lamin tail domain-containing protein [Candidatus Paceibacterota bacterium]
MKIKNLLFGTILVVGLIGFLAIPSMVYAEFNLFGFSKEENPQTFSEFQAKNILTQFSKKIFNRWAILMANAYSDPRETTTLSFLRQAINYDVWNYLFQDLPIDVSVKVGKSLAEIVQIMTSDNVMKMAIEKLERDSVKMSVDYLKQELFKHEVKIAFGATKVKYDTGKEKIDTSFQYIMAYTPIDDKKGNIVVRIYSPYELDPPETSASYGLTTGVINDLKPGEKLPPFVVEFKGVISNKNFSWYYQWEGEPEIKVYFPNNVPDFGFKAVPWYDKYIIDPVKKTINNVLNTLGGFFLKSETVDYINLEESNTPSEEAKQEAEEMLNGVNDYIETEKEEEIVENIKETKTQIALEDPKEEVKIQEPEEEVKPKQEIKKECPLSNSNPKSNTILINEVAWMGSKNSASDEWIELKNISSAAVSLKGWALYDREKQINILIENDLIVPSQGFVLFERTDDSAVSFIMADQIYTGALSNTNESLYLFNANCVLEDFVTADSSWPAGNSKERLTMERGKDLTWQDYDGLGYMEILGTPRQENSEGKKQETTTVTQTTIKSSTETTTKTTASSSSGGGGGGGGVTINYCTQSNLNEPFLSPVVVNEVAWMGTELSSSDEWIELKNVSEEEVNMNGWQLLDKDNQIKIIFDSADIIPANGLYLLERTDDSSVPNIQANKIYSGALSDGDETLRLFNSNCQLIDEVVAQTSWFAGDKDLKKTMERDSVNWHTYSLLNIDNVSGLWGTPKKENSERVIENNNQEIENIDETEEKQDNLTRPSSLLITEISLDDNEYVEIFNQTEEDINLCLDENNCYYLSYYANATTVHSWDDPNYNWRFKDGLIINSNSYILIDVYGDSGGDFKVGEYSSQKLSNSSGSLSLFLNNPIYNGEEEKTQEEKISYAQALKVDTIAWKKTSDNEPEVREGSAFIISNGKVLGRKYYSGKYIDSNNNIDDFEEQKQSIKTNPAYPPEAITDLSISQGQEKNSVVLSWSYPIDPDTSKEDLDYEIYYSLNKEIDINDLKNIEDYTIIDIEKKENNVSVLINDLYYDSNYYFGIKVKDPQLNYSNFSNTVSQTILKAEHVKSFYYIDYGMRNKSNFAGPTGDSLTVETFIKGEDQGSANDEFSLPVIDENENVYISGRMDGLRGVFVFDKSGNKKWNYQCISSEKISLGSDGTIYFFCEEKLTALSPSGKLKWEEFITGVYKKDVVIDSNKRMYFISNAPSLVVIKDNGENIERNTYNFEKNYSSFSKILIDQSNNVYFFADNNLFKFNGSVKTGERIVEILYDEEYEGDKDKTGIVNELAMSLNGTLLFNLNNARVDKEGKTHSILYALDKNNISSEFIWSTDDMHCSLIGINEDELFIQNSPLGSYAWYHLYLYGINILTGEVNWTKHWSSNGSAVYMGSYITTDTNNNIYFNQGGEIKAYNSKEITDEDPDNNKVFSITGLGYSYSVPITLGKGVLYFVKEREIKKIDF